MQGKVLSFNSPVIKPKINSFYPKTLRMTNKTHNFFANTVAPVLRRVALPLRCKCAGITPTRATVAPTRACVGFYLQMGFILASLLLNILLKAIIYIL